jgi:hypothetical protein
MISEEENELGLSGRGAIHFVLDIISYRGLPLSPDCVGEKMLFIEIMVAYGSSIILSDIKAISPFESDIHLGVSVTLEITEVDLTSNDSKDVVIYICHSAGNSQNRTIPVGSTNARHLLARAIFDVRLVYLHTGKHMYIKAGYSSFSTHIISSVYCRQAIS